MEYETMYSISSHAASYKKIYSNRQVCYVQQKSVKHNQNNNNNQNSHLQIKQQFLTTVLQTATGGQQTTTSSWSYRF